MEEVFRNEFGRLHYITPEENKAVIRFQRAGVFSSSSQAYYDAGIELIPVQRAELKDIKKRNRATIEGYIKKTDTKIDSLSP